MDYIILIKEAFASQAVIATILGYLLSLGNYKAIADELFSKEETRIQDRISKEEYYEMSMRIRFANDISKIAKRGIFSICLSIVLQIILLFVDSYEHEFAASCLVLFGSFCIGRFISMMIQYGLGIIKFNKMFEGFSTYSSISSNINRKLGAEKNSQNEKSVSFKDTNFDDYKQVVLNNKVLYMKARGIESEKDLSLCDKYIIENIGVALNLGFDTERPNSSYIKVASILMETKGKNALKNELRVLSKHSKKDV